MRVKLQLVISHDDGHEETVTDVITLNKNNKRIEHLGFEPGRVQTTPGHPPAPPPPTASHHLSRYAFSVPGLRHAAPSQVPRQPRIGFSNAILAPDPPEHNPPGIPRRRCGALSSPRAAVGWASGVGGRVAYRTPGIRRWRKALGTAPNALSSF